MTKAIMISIRPEWVVKILNGKKTIEIRKTQLKCELPIDVYIYCTKDQKHLVAPFRFIEGWIYKEFNDTTSYSCGSTSNMGEEINGKVVAKFTLNKVDNLRKLDHIESVGLIMYKGAMDMGEYNKYNGSYAWFIDNLVIFDKPKELNNFYVNNAEALTGMEDIKYCDWLTVKKAPQSWCYVEVEE